MCCCCVKRHNSQLEWPLRAINDGSEHSLPAKQTALGKTCEELSVFPNANQSEKEWTHIVHTRAAKPEVSITLLRNIKGVGRPNQES